MVEKRRHDGGGGGVEVKFWTFDGGRDYQNWISANKGAGEEGPDFGHLVIT